MSLNSLFGFCGPNTDCTVCSSVTALITDPLNKTTGRVWKTTQSHIKVVVANRAEHRGDELVKSDFNKMLMLLCQLDVYTGSHLQ